MAISEDRNYCYLYFNDNWLRIIGIPLVAFIMPVAFFNVRPSQNLGNYLITVLVSVLYVSIYWHFYRGVMIYFRKRLPSLKDFGKRVAIQSVVYVLFTLLVSLGSFAVGIHRFPQVFERPSVDIIILASLIITLMISSIYEVVFGVEMWKRSLIENERLQKERAEAQLISLNNQLNPHFLFNSLNTLTALIPRQPDTAVLFTEELAKVYRYILNMSNKKLVTVEKEMEGVRSFQYLWQKRYSENISFDIDLPQLIKELHVPPLSIQMLVENAIKHNIISSENPLKVSITHKEDMIWVSNNLQVRNTLHKNGKGLSNIIERYKYLTERHVEVTRNEYFIVKIPVLKVDVK